jgi:pyridoxal phosphate enzyme (YggS family)
MGSQPESTEAEAESLAAARQRILDRIGGACARVGRDPGDVTLVAVSKTVPVERLRVAIAAGFDVLGENRVQEGEPKIAALRPIAPNVRWHLIGPLQSNKARRAVETFDMVESVDSVGLAERLDRLVAGRAPGRLPVLLQVNVDADPGKAGFEPGALDDAVARLADLQNLEVAGLMTIGRLVPTAEDARPTFRALRDLSVRVRAGRPSLGPALSMGMSDDFWVAAEEGATIVRVGRALFGERPLP